MNKKIQVIEVQNIAISILKVKDDDFICLTDMAKAKEGDARAADIIKNWMRNRSTLEFLGTWEQMYNPDFKVVEFDHFKMQAGLPSFVLSPGQWVGKTCAMGIYVQSGRYGGTYAHKDIAFEFGSAISPVFKLYLIKEYQRLKEIETNQYNLEWSVKRILSKANYLLHTDAIKNHIIPDSDFTRQTEWIAYAEEADLLNVALFGCTAKQWREANPGLALENNNIRDFASINELAILSNLESHNSEMINALISKSERFNKLRTIAQYQVAILNKQDFMKSLKKTKDDIYLKSGDDEQ
ncbi:MAG: KilA-N domain-containing protein [Bacteroidales bacterium]